MLYLVSLSPTSFPVCRYQSEWGPRPSMVRYTSDFSTMMEFSTMTESFWWILMFCIKPSQLGEGVSFLGCKHPAKPIEGNSGARLKKDALCNSAPGVKLTNTRHRRYVIHIYPKYYHSTLCQMKTFSQRIQAIYKIIDSLY